MIAFVKYPEPGSVKTRLSESIGAEAAASAYKLIANHVISTLDFPTLPQDMFYFWDGDAREIKLKEWLGESKMMIRQIGSDLGKRMSVAFQFAFDQGASKVAIIGSDCPGISPAIIRKAYRALDHSDLVLGPCFDGGYYLVGMKQLHTSLFNGIIWSAGSVLEETLSRADQNKLKYKLLKKLRDLDTFDDIKKYVQANSKALGREKFLVQKLSQIIDGHQIN